MKLLNLSNNKQTIVDDDYQTNYHYSYDHGYARRFDKNGRGFYLHREVIGAADGEIVDHINQNKLDNRTANLRIVKHYQNLHNTKLNKRNKSGHRGIHWSKSYSKWVAQLSVDGKRVVNRSFHNLEDATLYLTMARKKYIKEAK